jgi:type IV pilus assembly protein PilB
MSVTLEHKPLGQVLVGRGMLQPARLEAALDAQRRDGHKHLLGEILVEMRECTEEQIAEALALSFGLPFARISPELADKAVLNVLPADFARANTVLPLFVVNDVLTIAMGEPANVFLIDEISKRTGKKVQVVASMSADILSTIERMQSELASVMAPVVVPVPAPAEANASAAAAPAVAPVEDASVVLVNECLQAALNESASDVHFEPGVDSFRIRARVDGRLTDKSRPPQQAYASVVARLKAIAGLNVAEQRLPQEGCGKIEIAGRSIELRVHTMPGPAGEKLVVRLTENDRVSLNLEKLGFSYEMLKQWTKLIARPQGLILVTGPVGSGRNSTLSTTLQARAADDLNVCTIEDPIAYAIPGVNQFQVNADAGLTLAKGLAGMLRQDPDVILISELRDAETAQLAAAAASRGKLVFAGLNTADTVSAIPHLLHLGVEPYLLASTLAGVLSQRLVRRLCQSCKQLCAPDASELRQFDPGTAPTGSLYGPKGCDRCRNIGYSGRVGVFELLIPNDAITDGITRGLPISDLRTLAQQAGLQPLRADAIEKAKAGITSLTEVVRVC